MDGGTTRPPQRDSKCVSQSSGPQPAGDAAVPIAPHSKPLPLTTPSLPAKQNLEQQSSSCSLRPSRYSCCRLVVFRKVRRKGSAPRHQPPVIWPTCLIQICPIPPST